MLVGVDDSRGRMVCSAERFGKKALGRGRVLLGREKEVEGGAGGIHRPVKVTPLAFHSDVGLVHPPTVVGRFEPRIPQRFHKRRYPEAMKPLILPHEKWLDKVATGKKVPDDNGDPIAERFKFLTQTWLYELSQRRGYGD